ncbi:DUF2244 domain-containing protein [Ascidiaceihabitans sp.]|uniref:DUF2244 domain-containing protein n=1 Tax=Ascidiaceihabitans sp. TaxID=1872644 RepID=UPI0032989195
MPYHWTNPPHSSPEVMQLWPHESLPPKGMAAFVLSTFTLILIPTLPLLGSPILWGLLPFLLLAVWGIYFALQRNHKARQIVEVLTLSKDAAVLVRTNPKGDQQIWECNRYWTQAVKYDSDGPVPHYVTLRGNGREVEIGAFLSEEERIELYDDLLRALKR